MTTTGAVKPGLIPVPGQPFSRLFCTARSASSCNHHPLSPWSGLRLEPYNSHTFFFLLPFLSKTTQFKARRLPDRSETELVDLFRPVTLTTGLNFANSVSPARTAEVQSDVLCITPTRIRGDGRTQKRWNEGW